MFVKPWTICCIYQHILESKSHMIENSKVYVLIKKWFFDLWLRSQLGGGQMWNNNDGKARSLPLLVQMKIDFKNIVFTEQILNGFFEISK